MTATDRPTGRVALVTGAAGGIGTAVVDRLVARGHVVYAVDLDPVDDRHGDRVVPVVADVREAADVGRVVDQVRDERGVLHVVVAGAGVIDGGAPLWETDDAVLDALWRADAVSVWNTAKATLPLLLERTADDRPSFVAIASVAGQRGLYRLAAYSMAKHAVVGLVRSLAADVVGSPVTVAGVCPGSTDTAMLAATARLYGLDDIGALVQEQASGRALQPDEVAAVVELACLAGPVLNGAVLPADGGFRL